MKPSSIVAQDSAPLYGRTYCT